MSSQNPRIFNAIIATGASLSSLIDTGGGYLYVSVEIPASGAAAAYNTSAGSPLWIRGANSSAGTPRRFYEIYTNAVANAFTVQSSVCNAMVPISFFNYRYIQLEISGTVTGAGGGVQYNVICTDSL